jgi:carbohydrate kinase (thermoresistant glucokinase family)
MTEAGAAVVVMGVAGSGKSTVGGALAVALGAAFIDADDLHDAAAVAKMARAEPLTDEDRAPWLGRVGEAIATATAAGGSVVVACSALRRRYRELIDASAQHPVFFAHLSTDRDTLADRMANRGEHFMPVALLDSQLETIEPLEPDENGATLDAGAPVAEIVQHIVAALP